MTTEPMMPVDTLKPREIEVLRHIADGLSNQEIAEQLHIAVTTVRWHNRQLYSKLGVHTRTLAVAHARQLGLLDKDSPNPSSVVNQPTSKLHNLTVHLTPFIGRKREINKIISLFRSSRLLTLTGPGGVGKTRIVLQVAQDLQADFPDGVWFIPLAAIRDAGLVTNTIINTLNVPEVRNETPEVSLTKHLQNLQLLLIIDNFEHVIHAAPILSHLLKNVADLKILVTSREVLHIYGEQEYPVPPLTIPEESLAVWNQDTAQYESVALFTERARAINPDFQLDDHNAAAVAEICARLDGLPLAIELAAARMKLFTPHGLVDNLRNGLDALGKGPRDVPARQRTLRAAIGWSFDLLSDDENTLLTRLSVFNGGWQLAAMEAVCGDGLQIDMLDGLQSLIDKSLVQMDTHDSEPRFSMLDTLRQFAAEQLDTYDKTSVRAQHFEWCLDLAEQAERGLQGRDAQRWYHLLRLEEANMRTALDWCAKESEQLEHGVHLAGALWSYWHLCGKFHEGRGWLTLLLNQVTSVSSSAQARALNGAGVMAYRQGDYNEVVRYCEEALEISEALGDRNGSALALHYLAHVQQDQGDYDRATEILSRSLDLYTAQQNDWGRAQTMNCLGDLHRQLGHYDSAFELLEAALVLQRSLNNRRGMMVVSSNLGHVLYRLQDIERSNRCIRESLAIAQALNSKPYITLILDGFAGLAVASNQYKRGATLLGALETLLPEVGVVLEPPDRVDHDYNVAQTRQFLDEETFEAAWAHGQLFSLTQAVDYALDNN